METGVHEAFINLFNHDQIPMAKVPMMKKCKVILERIDDNSNKIRSNFENNVKPRISEEIPTEEVKIKVELKEEEFDENVQNGMEVLKSLQNKLKLQVECDVKEEDFEEHVQNGMDILENL